MNTEPEMAMPSSLYLLQYTRIAGGGGGDCGLVEGGGEQGENIERYWKTSDVLTNHTQTTPQLYKDHALTVCSAS